MQAVAKVTAVNVIYAIYEIKKKCLVVHNKKKNDDKVGMVNSTLIKVLARLMEILFSCAITFANSYLSSLVFHFNVLPNANSP